MSASPHDVRTPPVARSGVEEATLRLAPDHAGLILPVTIGGRYELVERLGGGGMANVYRARDPHLDRDVAVKLMTPKLRLDPEFDGRFRREARIVSKLNDPHVVVVHDFGIDPDYGPFLVMELLLGRTLRDRLNDDGPLELPAAMQLGEQLMLALAHAHAHEVIHRDLKPDNVFLLAQSGVRLHVRVLDFGIARILQPESEQSPTDLTEPGAVVGTPRYMSPEQQAGKSATEQSDLYTAALVIYEALTAQLPEIVGPRIKDLVRNVPEGLVRLIEQCLYAEPDRRPFSAMEAYVQLHELSRKTSGSLLMSESATYQLTARFRDEEPPAPAPAKSHRRAWLASLGVLAIALGGLGGWLALNRDPCVECESLCGIRLDQDRDEVVHALGAVLPKSPTHAGDPWRAKSNPLVPWLQPADVPLTAAELASAELYLLPKQSIAVLFVHGRVRAVAGSPADGTPIGRHLRIGQSATALATEYPEPRVGDFIDEHPLGRVVYHYSTVGLTVEVRGERVVGAALFPRKP